jgi:hypothetical protein
MNLLSDAVVFCMAIITADLTDGFQVSITNGRHTWASDEPLNSVALMAPTPMSYCWRL